MHFRTHCADKHKGKSGGQGDYNDVMVAHDENIGLMLNKLDELGIADDTIVMYSTDNGVHYNTWPDAGITPFRSEKNTNWEGGWRVPCFVRWPGQIKAGTVLNGIVSHQDWLPTFLAAAGEPDIKEKLLKGHKVGEKTYKVHIDGFNMLPYLTGEVKESPRKFFFYISDDGDILAIRMQDWKVVLMEQRAKTLQCWFEPFVKLRAPKMFNLRRDPFERADENSNTYWDWVISHAYIIYGMQALVAQQIENFKKFPPRQKPASFNLDAVMRTSRRRAAAQPLTRGGLPSAATMGARLDAMSGTRRIMSSALVAQAVSAFYERYPYPPPVDDLEPTAGHGPMTGAAPSPPVLAGRALSGRPQHPGGRLRHVAGRQGRVALALGPGDRDRRQRHQHPADREAQAKARHRESRVGATAGRAGHRIGQVSTTWSAPACCITCPIPTRAWRRCTMCSHPRAPCT